MDLSGQLPKFQDISIETVVNWDVEDTKHMFAGKRIIWGLGNTRYKDTFSMKSQITSVTLLS